MTGEKVLPFEFAKTFTSTKLRGGRKERKEGRKEVRKGGKGGKGLTMFPCKTCVSLSFQ